MIRADAEGQGIARALIAATTKWARERGLANVTLGTGAANNRARAFYTSLGFVEEDVRFALHLEFGSSGRTPARR